MPLPKPKKDEPKDKFLDRCMADEVMNEEYPEDDQRFAVCNTIWKDKDKKSQSLETILADIYIKPFAEAEMEKSMEPERRFCTQPELRVEDRDKPIIVGYAAVFDEKTTLWGGYEEVIAQGAFTDALKNDPDVMALVDHDSSRVLGRTKPGTLKLKQDDHGLKATITPNMETTTGKDTAANIKRGDIDKMSFAFYVAPGGQDTVETETGVVRTITKIEKLVDVSTVTYPAYAGTEVGLRAAMRACGLSDEKALAILLKRDNMKLSEDDMLWLRDAIERLKRHLQPISLSPERDSLADYNNRLEALKAE